MAYSTSNGKRYRGGKRCVAGGPNLVSYANNQQNDGKSMHLFPNEETDQQIKTNKVGKFCPQTLFCQTKRPVPNGHFNR
jgi:hypothetical protein